MEPAERDLTWEEIDALIADAPPESGPPPARESSVEIPASRPGPRPVLRLATEHVTIDRSGGLGAMIEISRAPGLNGHFVINDPDLWAPPTNEYLATLP